MTEIIELTQEEWDSYQAGSEGICTGCFEPNAFCQCADCPDCLSRHDPNFSCG